MATDDELPPDHLAWIEDSKFYERCTDPECTVLYAYRFDGREAPHYHYTGDRPCD